MTSGGGKGAYAGAAPTQMSSASSSVTIQASSTAPAQSSSALSIPAGCGNSVHEAGEECDDGNNASDDGCSSACTVEGGWVCTDQCDVAVNTVAPVRQSWITSLLAALVRVSLPRLTAQMGCCSGCVPPSYCSGPPSCTCVGGMMGTCCMAGVCTYVAQGSCSGGFTLGGTCTPNPCPPIPPMSGACCMNGGCTSPILGPNCPGPFYPGQNCVDSPNLCWTGSAFSFPTSQASSQQTCPAGYSCSMQPGPGGTCMSIDPPAGCQPTYSGSCGAGTCTGGCWRCTGASSGVSSASSQPSAGSSLPASQASSASQSSCCTPGSCIGDRVCLNCICVDIPPSSASAASSTAQSSAASQASSSTASSTASPSSTASSLSASSGSSSSFTCPPGYVVMTKAACLAQGGTNTGTGTPYGDSTTCCLLPAASSAQSAASSASQASSAAAASSAASSSSDGQIWFCPNNDQICDVLVSFSCGKGSMTDAIDLNELFKEELKGTAHLPNGEEVTGVNGGEVLSGSFQSQFGFEPGRLRFSAQGKIDQNAGALLLEVVPIRNHQHVTPRSGTIFWTGIRGVDELELSLGNIEVGNQETSGTLILRRIRRGQERWRLSHDLQFRGGGLWTPVLILWGPEGLKLGGYPTTIPAGLPGALSVLDERGPLIPIGPDLYLGDEGDNLNLTFRNFQLCGNEAGTLLPITGDSSSSASTRCRSVCHRMSSASSTVSTVQSSSLVISTIRCGNGLLEGSEQCESGHPCPSGGFCMINCQCQVWSSSFASSASSIAQLPRCGNGLLEGSEQCESGYPCPGGGFCTASCTCELPSSSAFSAMSFAPLPPHCGNGVQEPGEECDDGNLILGDGCSPSCQWEGGPTLIPNEVFCGNGKLEESEECEISVPCPEDLLCSVGCRCSASIPPSERLTAPPSQVAGGEALCGNGLLEFPEECDDGPRNGPLDLCSTSCKILPCTQNNQCPTNYCSYGYCMPCTQGDQCPLHICLNGVCLPCLTTGECLQDQVCQSGSCVPCTADNQCRTGLCTQGSCVPCSRNEQCATRLCVDGACIPCDERTPCPAGQMCQHNACAFLLQEAVRGAAQLSPATRAPSLLQGHLPVSPKERKGVTITFPAVQAPSRVTPSFTPSFTPYASVIPSAPLPGPVGQTGPASIAVMAAGAAAGFAWTRRRKKSHLP